MSTTVVLGQLCVKCRHFSGDGLAAEDLEWDGICNRPVISLVTGEPRPLDVVASIERERHHDRYQRIACGPGGYHWEAEDAQGDQ